MSADKALFTLINNLAGKNQLLDFLGIFFAEYLGYLLIVLAIFLIFSFSDWKEKFYYFSLFALAVLLSRGILTELIRFVYYRPRPFSILDVAPIIAQSEKAAFPSGHAAFYFALAGVIFLINKKFGWYATGAAILIGLARVFVGVHWPLDIAGGLIIGFLSVFIVNLLLVPHKPLSAAQGGKRELLQ